ncbi:MAG: TIGR04283 family arsenosugar biosynthesis glycosyltransferase [Deltaproteobacteria bacterium]|nr:TIGR04283 family arsenosugar biosynthesis glycosyltransferase [Deltaproteobacteria bacterium]
MRKAAGAILAASSTSLSVIIPTLNESSHIGATLASAMGDAETEVVVVDGGSVDDTRKQVQAWGCKLLVSSPGRAVQMNMGASVASGKVLLFLHADTRLPPGYRSQVHSTLGAHGVVAGAFRLGIDGSGRALRLVEMLANWRSTTLQLPYGDQALFMKAARFQQIGGFPTMPIMEDLVLVSRLRKIGRIAIAPVAVQTSARRWQEIGVGKATVINQIMLYGFFLGLSPERLARFYGRWL